jgi:hypothetical protein
MRFYFVATGLSNKTEIAVIRALQPKNIMLSFYYWKNTSLEDFIKVIGYKPRIILDSGAYSAYTKGKEIDLEKYVEYYKKNKKWVNEFINLDKLGDNEKSFEVYQVMRERGLKPMPVFHYLGDEKYLQRYIEDGNVRIALGGTVPVKNKNDVAAWVKMLTWLYPEVKFHLLGSAARKVLDHCDIESADAATWMIQAINGNPKHIPGRDSESRKERAFCNMFNHIKLYDWGIEN